MEGCQGYTVLLGQLRLTREALPRLQVTLLNGGADGQVNSRLLWTQTLGRPFVVHVLLPILLAIYKTR